MAKRDPKDRLHEPDVDCGTFEGRTRIPKEPTVILPEFRRTFFGIDSGSRGVDCGFTASLSTPVSKRCIIERLTVSREMVKRFVLSDIRVGIEPLLGTTSNMSLAVFIPEARHHPFRRVICEIGMEVSLVVTCIARRPPRGQTGHRFIASLVAEIIPPCQCDRIHSAER